MIKRFQVFVSSTFRDLIDERQAVLKAILEIGHMPAGMELFPAADAKAWELIKEVIDVSDYYVVIIGGRYGSVDEDGISYTQKEYEYAIKVGLPVIPLLHQNPDNLPRGRTDTNEVAWKRLKEFRAIVEENHHCSYWTSADDLKAKVIIGVNVALTRDPRTGWVRSDSVVLSLDSANHDFETQIEAYWPDKGEAVEELRRAFESAQKSLVVCAITLNTVESVLRNKTFVQNLAQKMLENPDFSVSFVVHQPESGPSFEARNLEKDRDLNAAVALTLENLRRFRKALVDIDMSLGLRIKTLHYNRVNPSRFIVCADKTIYIGPYLASQYRGTTFLMRLRQLGTGSMWQYFQEEIDHIISDSLPLKVDD